MPRSYRSYNKQSGAALVVGLILLVVVTLMAVSSMNTATLDLVMAGNEQYRSRAFAAAETAIEQAWHNGVYDSSADSHIDATPTGTGNDKYRYEITRPNKGNVEVAPGQNSIGTFGVVYFQITGTGTSERNASAVTTQELFELVKKSDETSYDNDACSGTSDLDAAASSCS